MKSCYLQSVVCAAALGGCMLGCFNGTQSPASSTGEGTSAEYSAILTDYSQKVVVAIYKDMKDKAIVLQNAIKAYSSDPSSQNLLDSAGAAWKTVRTPWEVSEAFLFGPVAFTGLDPALDSWPVDQQQLNAILSSNLTLDEESVELLGPVVKGFHTIEYLIFRNGKTRSVDSVTAREREYLVAVTDILTGNAEQLWAAWATGEYEGSTGTAYATEFANAGKAGSRYLSQADAVIEMIEGMITISDEVGSGKLADPSGGNDVTLVESQFAWNSITDFQNDIRGVRDSYLGAYHLSDDSGHGITEYVRSRNADLDSEVRAAIQGAIDAIGAIPHPFRNNLTHANVAIAVAKCIALRNILDEEVKPLIR